MIDGFTWRVDSMTGIAAIAHNIWTSVVHKLHSKCPRVVTIAAIRRGNRMVGCRVFSGCIYTVVARFTQARNIAVIEVRILKIVRRMTQVTITFGWNMRIILACRYNAVMTNVTITSNTRMIKRTIYSDVYETRGIVAVIAFGCCKNMMRGLTNRNDAIMTSTTIAKNFFMINKGKYRKTQR